MSNLIKSALKELTEDLNLIQTKKREISRKYDYPTRTKLFQEIKTIKLRSTDLMNEIENEFQVSSIKIRNEYKGAIDNCKSEYLKTIKELEKLEISLNKERLIDPTSNSDFDNDNAHKYQFLNSKLSDQNKTLTNTNKMGNEIVKTQATTLHELDRQKNQIIKIDNTVSEVEEQMSLHDQIFQVMDNRELFNKLKLVLIVALLLLADIIVVYIKLF